MVENIECGQSGIAAIGAKRKQSSYQLMYYECLMNYVSESRWRTTTKYFVTPKVVANGIMLALARVCTCVSRKDEAE